MHSFVASLFLSRINVMINSLYHTGIFCPNTGKETLLWTNQTILNLPHHFENETKLTKLKLILSLDQDFTKSRALKAGLFVKSTYELNVKAKLETDGDRIPSPPPDTHTLASPLWPGIYSVLVLSVTSSGRMLQTSPLFTPSACWTSEADSTTPPSPHTFHHHSQSIILLFKS